MKRKILLLLLSCVMMLCSTVNATGSVEVAFSYDDFSISIDAKNLPASNAVTAIYIMNSAEEISENNIPLYSYVYQTDTNGDLKTKIMLPYGVGSGRCYIYLDSSAFHETKQCVVLYNKDPETVLLIERVKECHNGTELFELLSNTDNAENLGLDLSGVGSQVLLDASSVCVGEISDIENLTAKQFFDAMHNKLYGDGLHDDFSAIQEMLLSKKRFFHTY